MYSVGDWQGGEAFEGFSPAPKLVDAKTEILGRSPQLGRRQAGRYLEYNQP